ncbi:MAG: hypothetical protein JOZ49_06575 [Mycolicibacterium sp.]|nr:hypothetical protein [Mycolicibacterium sp.]
MINVEYVDLRRFAEGSPKTLVAGILLGSDFAVLATFAAVAPVHDRARQY